MTEKKPLPGEKVRQTEKAALQCKNCGTPLAELGLCSQCKNYNLPARNGEYLFIKPEEFADVEIHQSGSSINFSFADFTDTNMTVEEINVIGNENLEFGKILFAFWFQKHKNLFPRGTRPTIREVRDYLDEVVSIRKWS